MTPDASDAELARLIAAGVDAGEAEGVLFRRYAPRVELYGLKHLRSDAAAQDLTQQVMLRVVEAIRAGRLEDPERLSSFVFGTCRNVSWDMRRADLRQRKIERDNAGLASDHAPPEHSERDVVRLRRCMAGLPEREATVLRMTFMEDATPEEVAGRLGVTLGNVRVIRHRALAKLASCVAGKDAS